MNRKDKQMSNDKNCAMAAIRDYLQFIYVLIVINLLKNIVIHQLMPLRCCIDSCKSPLWEKKENNERFIRT